jgi:transcriptional regulator with XRE-family HTH domain
MKLQMDFEVLGAELRAARSQLKLSIRRLSSESGLHRSTIAKIEAGKPGWPEIARTLRHTLESRGALFNTPRSALLAGQPAESAWFARYAMIAN